VSDKRPESEMERLLYILQDIRVTLYVFMVLSLFTSCTN
jgi:hypothetical protein